MYTLQEEHPEDAVLDTTGAQAHVYANLRVTTPPMERPLQKRPHSDFVTREAAKEAAGLKGANVKSGTLPQSTLTSLLVPQHHLDQMLFRTLARPVLCVMSCPCYDPLTHSNLAWVVITHRMPTSCRARDCSIYVMFWYVAHVVALRTPFPEAGAKKLPVWIWRRCWPRRRASLSNSRQILSAFSGAEEAEVQSPRTAKQTRRKQKQRAWLYNEVRAS